MPKVLIVEDEIFLSDMYRMKFESEGFEVAVAANGADGYKLAKQIKPDLVFLDLIMPLVDGFQALKMIREDEETKNLLIVVLSNLGQEEEIAKVMTQGANAFLVKASLTPKQLVEKARELLLLEAKISEQSLEILEGGEPEVLPEHKDTKILFIEDNKEIIMMYRLQFEKCGYNIELAENGAWGLKMAQQKKYDIIVMDLMMPAMNGYEMLRVIKMNSANQDTPVIVISNSAQDEEIEKALEAGANKFLIKSQIAPKELIAEIAILTATE